MTAEERSTWIRRLWDKDGAPRPEEAAKAIAFLLTMVRVQEERLEALHNRVARLEKETNR